MNVLKNNIRETMKEKRDALDTITKAEYDQSIFNRLKKSSFYAASNVVFVYVSFRSEVDTIKIIHDMLDTGKTVCVPRINRSVKEMEAFRISGIEDLKMGYFNILEPQGSCQKVDADDIKLILMPGLAFDRNGGRVGYGGGFYDKFLQNTKSSVNRIALAYSFQVLSKVPLGPMDIRVDGIITEKEFINVKE